MALLYFYNTDISPQVHQCLISCEYCAKKINKCLNAIEKDNNIMNLKIPSSGNHLHSLPSLKSKCCSALQMRYFITSTIQYENTDKYWVSTSAVCMKNQCTKKKNICIRNCTLEISGDFSFIYSP